MAHNHIGKPSEAYALDGSSKKTVVNIKRCATAPENEPVSTASSFSELRTVQVYIELKSDDTIRIRI